MSSKNANKNLDALIVLGKNWKEYPPNPVPKSWKIHLSIESKLTCLAVGEIYKKLKPYKIIFSSGKTAGKDWPSEAEAMWNYTKNRFPNIPNNKIILEEESIDTAGNAEKAYGILQKYKIKHVVLLTISSHLPRSVRIFANYGIKTNGTSSQEILRNSKNYKNFVKEYDRSGKVIKENLMEIVLRAILHIDPKGKLLRIVTRKLRHAEV